MAELVCPTCRTKVTFRDLAEIPYRPFCCERCKMVDLGKWLNEEFKVSEPLDDPRHQPPPPQQSGRDNV